MITLFGLTILYSWIHAVYIVIQNNPVRTKYELTVLWYALITVILYIAGTL